MRKITFGNRSSHGVKKHEIIMSIVETGRLNGVEPLKLFLGLTLGDTSFIDEPREIKFLLWNNI